MQEEFNIKAEKSYRVNEGITAPQVRLVDQDGEQRGVVALKDALAIAKESDHDLVEIAPNADPPVCRITKYGKYLYEINKKLTEQKKKQKRSHIKEIKLRPTTDLGDFNRKVLSIKNFLEDGDKVKVTVRFRGRELMHPTLGMELLKRIEAALLDSATVEQQPKLEGKQIIMTLAPKKKQ